VGLGVSVVGVLLLVVAALFWRRKRR